MDLHRLRDGLVSLYRSDREGNSRAVNCSAHSSVAGSTPDGIAIDFTQANGTGLYPYYHFQVTRSAERNPHCITFTLP